jgi:rhodanese-related sulfurtransferase
MNFLERIFGKKVDLQEVISGGAIILDVRTKGEYQTGHLRNSINIPVDKLPENLKKLDKNKPIITCCASGARSASAMRILKSNGFEQVYNGGSWINLKKYN